VKAGLLALLVGSGCGAIAVVEEGSGGAGGASVTTSTSKSTAVTSTASKSGSSQTGMPDLCQTPVGASCDVFTFPLCEPEQVSGIPCCYITKACGPFGVEWEPAACTDDCAQNCELIQNPEHCEAVPWCALGPDGCEFAAPPP
jgi:hypothetical protein